MNSEVIFLYGLLNMYMLILANLPEKTYISFVWTQDAT